MSRTSLSLVLRLAALFTISAPPAWTASAPAAAGPQNGNQEPERFGSAQVDRHDRVRFMNESASVYLNNPRLGDEPAVFYFPPLPPSLGSEVAFADSLATGPTAPAGLAPFVNEVFYPLLANRLASGSLTPALRQQLEGYRTAKLALQNELRSRIAAAGELEAAARERQLADFAAEQTPRIVALEAAAEKLRTDLRTTGLLGLPDRTDDWLEVTNERLPAAPKDRPSRAEILRAAAFFQDGLSIEQRHLLREAALSDPGAGQSDRLLLFTPATSRIPVDPSLPPLLQQKIGHYTSAKAALKNELIDVLQTLPSVSGGHTAAARKLAIAQAPRFAALDAIAEEIRRELAARPGTAGTAVTPALPSELSARITLYRSHKLEALRTLHALLIPNARPVAGETATRYVAADGSPLSADRSARVKQAVAEFDRTQAELVAALNKEKAAIRASLAELMRSSGGPQDRKSIDDLLRDFENARQQQELWEKFRDYHAAVLLPGLSPPQRRLLFDGALVQLGLPLPVGTVVP